MPGPCLSCHSHASSRSCATWQRRRTCGRSWLKRGSLAAWSACYRAQRTRWWCGRCWDWACYVGQSEELAHYLLRLQFLQAANGGRAVRDIRTANSRMWILDSWGWKCRKLLQALKTQPCLHSAARSWISYVCLHVRAVKIVKPGLRRSTGLPRDCWR